MIFMICMYLQMTPIKVRYHGIMCEDFRVHFLYAPSQWETTLYCNVFSHWLAAYTKWSLGLKCVTIVIVVEQKYPVTMRLHCTDKEKFLCLFRNFCVWYVRCCRHHHILRISKLHYLSHITYPLLRVQHFLSHLLLREWNITVMS